MKTQILILISVSAITASCQNNSRTSNTIDSASKAVKTDIQSNTTCYSMTKNRDTALLTLVSSGENVSGDLAYNLYEKDKNTGTISGKIKGDSILADYTFMSEGTTSTRKVVFVKKDNKLEEGTMVFDKIDCK